MVFDRLTADDFNKRLIFLTVDRGSSSACSMLNANVPFKSQRNEEMMFLRHFSILLISCLAGFQGEGLLYVLFQMCSSDNSGPPTSFVHCKEIDLLKTTFIYLI